MDNSVTINQHFVPRFYLKRFTRKDNKFWCYDFNKAGLLQKPVYYESQCRKKYFYGKDGLWENRLSEMERKWAISVSNVIENKPLSNDDIQSLKEFMLFQRQRTDAEYNHYIENRETGIIEYARAFCKQKGLAFDDEVLKICKQRAKEGVTPAENLFFALGCLSFIDDLNMLIVHYQTQTKLITSDAPVVSLNPFMRHQGFGYSSIGVAFIIPLSPEHLLIIYDSKLYPKYRDTIRFESDNEEEVSTINKYELIHAERMAFSPQKEDLIVSESIFDNREREQKRREPKPLGPVGDRIIAIQADGTDFYYDFPYTILPREWRRIPYTCRESIPRQFEEGWLNKLKVKYKVIQGAKRVGVAVDLPSKKELKLGCDRMERLALLYWKGQ